MSLYGASRAHTPARAFPTPPLPHPARAVCLLSLVALIVQMSQGYYWGAGLIASFFIPLLGWCGARFRSRCVILLFSVANLVMMLVFFAITVPFLMCA